MINEPLLSFIRTHLNLKTSREEIVKMLLSQGWTEEDANEGFRAIDPSYPGGGVPVPGTQVKAKVASEKENKSVKTLVKVLFAVIFFGVAVIVFIQFGLPEIYEMTASSEVDRSDWSTSIPGQVPTTDAPFD